MWVGKSKETSTIYYIYDPNAQAGNDVDRVTLTVVTDVDGTFLRIGGINPLRVEIRAQIETVIDPFLKSKVLSSKPPVGSAPKQKRRLTLEERLAEEEEEGNRRAWERYTYVTRDRAKEKWSPPEG